MKWFIEHGFILKRGQYTWSEEDIEKLKLTIIEIEITNGLIVHTINSYYWISQHRFKSKIPTKEIKKKCLQLFDEHCVVVT